MADPEKFEKNENSPEKVHKKIQGITRPSKKKPFSTLHFNIRSPLVWIAIAVILLIIICSLIVAYYLEAAREKEVKNLEKFQASMQRAVAAHKECAWQEALDIYLQMKTMPVSAEKIAQVNQEIQSLETARIKFQEKHDLLVTEYNKGEREFQRQNYLTARGHYEMALTIYQQNQKILSGSAAVQELLRQIENKITLASISEKNKTIRRREFHKFLKLAEQAMESENWQGAYHFYEKSYKICESKMEAEIKKKMEAAKDKADSAALAKFAAEQMKKNLVNHQGEWIPLEEKMRREGFFIYRNKWVQKELYTKLLGLDRTVRHRIKVLEKILRDKQREASNHVIISTKKQQYDGIILEKRSDGILVNLKFEAGLVQRTFKNSAIKEIKLVNPVFNDFFGKLEQADSVSTLKKLKQWCRKVQLTQGEELADCRIFLLDFTASQVVKTEWKDGGWLLVD